MSGFQLAIGYLYRRDPAGIDQDLRAIRRTARENGLTLETIWPDGGEPCRRYREHVLQAVRNGSVTVLIVPCLSQISRRPAEMIRLVDSAFANFTRARLLTCDGAFDSAHPNARLCWELFRCAVQLEKDCAIQ